MRNYNRDKFLESKVFIRHICLKGSLVQKSWSGVCRAGSFILRFKGTSEQGWCIGYPLNGHFWVLYGLIVHIKC